MLSSQILPAPFLLSPIQYLVALVDYFWVITIYISATFILATIIDGHILPYFDKTEVMKESSLSLVIQVLLQFALQGFIAIFLCIILQKIPSPVNRIAKYESNSSIGLLLRNPTIVYVILFALSKSLRGKLFILYSRFNKNAKDIIY
jgi:hypothetical protein